MEKTFGEKTSIKTSFGNGRGQTISAIVDMPENPVGYGVFAPCFTCVKESHGAVKICRALAALGFGMVRFDMTGLGASEGDFANTNFTTRIADITAAADFMTENYGAPDILVGHSISGTAALTAVHNIPSVKVVATVGSPEDPASIIEKFRKGGLMTESADGAVINVLGKPTPFDKNFVPDMLSQNTAADTARITQKLLVFHAPNDAIVRYANVDTIKARNPQAEIITLSDTATHLFEKGDEDAVFIAKTIAGRL